MGSGVIFRSRQKPVDQIHAIVFYALFAGTEVVFLASGVVGSRPVFGEEQVFVQGSHSHQQRPSELAGSNIPTIPMVELIINLTLLLAAERKSP